MGITLGGWGMGVVIGGMVVDLFVGDIYVRIPGVGELAWNSVGFVVNR